MLRHRRKGRFEASLEVVSHSQGQNQRAYVIDPLESAVSYTGKSSWFKKKKKAVVDCHLRCVTLDYIIIVHLDKPLIKNTAIDQMLQYHCKPQGAA